MTTRSPAQHAPPAESIPAGAGVREHWVRRARQLAWTGIAWHVIEFAIAVEAGIAASSVALIGFGADSLIEGLAGAIIIWRFAARRTDPDAAERRAQRLISVTYVILVVYIVVEATYALVAQIRPEGSWVGICLAVAAAASMPILARTKWRVATHLGSTATAKEGSQNMLCAYMAMTLLVGLLANAMFGWWWADPIAAFAISALALREARDAWRGDPDGCCAPVPIDEVATCAGGCCQD